MKLIDRIRGKSSLTAINLLGKEKKKIFVCVCVNEGIIDEAKPFVRKEDAILYWEYYTGKKYEDYLANSDLLRDSNVYDTHIYEEELIEPLSKKEIERLKR